MSIKDEKTLKNRFWELRDEYLNNLDQYSFDKIFNLKPMFQTAASYQSIATKHFLEFALQRIYLKKDKKSIDLNLKKQPNTINGKLTCLMTSDVGLENKESVIFYSSNQEIEFVFDHDKKEVVIQGQNGSWMEGKKEPRFNCIIPTALFDIIQEYTADER